MKKILLSAALVLTCTAFTKPAHSAVGFAIGSPVLIGVGGAMSISCVARIAQVQAYPQSQLYNLSASNIDLESIQGIVGFPCSILPQTVSLISDNIAGSGPMLNSEHQLWNFLQLITSVVLLDNQTSSIEFAKLSDDKADRLGISQVERSLFNQQLPLVNAVLNEASSAGSVEESSQIWLEAQAELAPETMIAVSKISAELRETLE